MSVKVAAELGFDPWQRRRTEYAARLHHVGRIAVPKEIINKPGPLNPDEWTLVLEHTVEGPFHGRRASWPAATRSTLWSLTAPTGARSRWTTHSRRSGTAPGPSSTPKVAAALVSVVLRETPNLRLAPNPGLWATQPGRTSRTIPAPPCAGSSKASPRAPTDTEECHHRRRNDGPCSRNAGLPGLASWGSREEGDRDQQIDRDRGDENRESTTDEPLGHIRHEGAARECAGHAASGHREGDIEIN